MCRTSPDSDHQRHWYGMELDPESEEAKRFDLLALSLQRALLRSEPGFERVRDPASYPYFMDGLGRRVTTMQ